MSPEAFSLDCSRSSPPCDLTKPLLCAHTALVSLPPSKGHQSCWIGWPWWPHLTFITSLKAVSRLRAATYEFRRTRFNPWQEGGTNTWLRRGTDRCLLLGVTTAVVLRYCWDRDKGHWRGLWYLESRGPTRANYRNKHPTGQANHICAEDYPFSPPAVEFLATFKICRKLPKTGHWWSRCSLVFCLLFVGDEYCICNGTEGGGHLILSTYLIPSDGDVGTKRESPHVTYFLHISLLALTVHMWTRKNSLLQPGLNHKVMDVCWWSPNQTNCSYAREMGPNSSSLSSSDRWQAAFMPRAYSDQPAPTVCRGPVMRRILGFRLNMQKTVHSLISHSVSEVEGGFRSTWTWKHRNQTDFLRYICLGWDPLWLPPDKSLPLQV